LGKTLIKNKNMGFKQTKPKFDFNKSNDYSKAKNDYRPKATISGQSIDSKTSRALYDMQSGIKKGDKIEGNFPRGKDGYIQDNDYVVRQKAPGHWVTGSGKNGGKKK
tara:strand:+ start:4854 stop:5174 length:321 start_codon:yes stop_codon:yes gene_type:complete